MDVEVSGPAADISGEASGTGGDDAGDNDGGERMDAVVPPGATVGSLVGLGPLPVGPAPAADTPPVAVLIKLLRESLDGAAEVFGKSGTAEACRKCLMEWEDNSS